MTHLLGRCRKGQRLRFAYPHRHWRTTAVTTIEGATDTEVFRAYVQEVLVATLCVPAVLLTDSQLY